MINKKLESQTIAVTYFSTTDLALAAAISLYFPLDLVDKSNPSKCKFLFVREDGLDQLVESFWRGDLLVKPLDYFNAIKLLKSRLYEG